MPTKQTIKNANKAAIRDQTAAESVTRAVVADALDAGLDYTDQEVLPLKTASTAFAAALDFSQNRVLAAYTMTGPLAFTVTGTPAPGTTVLAQVTGNGTDNVAFAAPLVVVGGAFDNTKVNYLSFCVYAANAVWVTISAGATVAATPNTTPAAPTLTPDDTADTLAASHALGASEILQSTNNGAYVAYTGTINIGNVNLAAGYYKFKIKAAAGRNESAVVSSPAFNATSGVNPGATTARYNCGAGDLGLNGQLFAWDNAVFQTSTNAFIGQNIVGDWTNTAYDELYASNRYAYDPGADLNFSVPNVSAGAYTVYIHTGLTNANGSGWLQNHYINGALAQGNISLAAGTSPANTPFMAIRYAHTVNHPGGAMTLRLTSPNNTVALLCGFEIVPVGTPTAIPFLS